MARSLARGASADPPRARTPDLPVARLRAVLQELGPAGASFAAYLSSRLDLLAAPDAEVLARPLPAPSGFAPEPDWSALKRLFRTNCGLDLDAAFKEFSPEPDHALPFEQCHRARLASGEETFARLVRPDAALQLDAAVDHLRGSGTILEDLCQAPAERILAEFHEATTEALDFERQMGDLETLAGEVGEIRYLAVPRVYRSLSGKGWLTIGVTGGRTVDGLARSFSGSSLNGGGRSARRLCRVWLELALQGPLFPLEPGPRNLAFLPDGGVAVTAGPFHRPDLDTQERLRSYLAATTSENHGLIVEEILELSERRPESQHRRLRHQLRHCDSFRDGQWDPSADRVARTALAHWYRAADLDFRPRRTSLAFLRSLVQMTRMIHRLAPGEEVLLESFQELRLRDLVSELSRFADRGEWAEAFGRQATLVTDLPLRIDRLLTAAEEPPEEGSVSDDAEHHGSGAWAASAGLMAALTAVALLARKLTDAPLWLDGAAAVAILGLGILLLLSMNRD